MVLVHVQAHNGHFLAADGSKVNLDHHRYAYTTWDMVSAGKDDVFMFKNEKSGKYLTSETDGKLMNDRTSPGDWEKWTIVNQGEGKVALRSHHKKHMCAEPDGKLVADRPDPRAWESFTIVLAAGKASFKNASTNEYLCADPGHTLTANRDKVGAWETFTVEIVETPQGVRNAIRSAHGKYLCAQPDGRVVADRDRAEDRERFTIKSGQNGFAIATWEGKFVQAETSCKLECDSKADGKKETWDIQNA
jgi:hypothetical protein